MFGKKKIEAVSVLDLRNYTPQALRKISSIQAVSTILLPENPSPAFAEAYADITKGAIAQEVFAPMDKVAQYNGLNVLGSTLPEGAICLCNDHLSAGCRGKARPGLSKRYRHCRAGHRPGD